MPEMSWGPNGRATFEHGSEAAHGEAHIILFMTSTVTGYAERIQQYMSNRF